MLWLIRVRTQRREMEAKDTVTFECRCGLYDFTPFPSAQDKNKICHSYECDAYNDGKRHQAEISFEAGINAVMEYLGKHWMGTDRGMLVYEIASKDRLSLEEGIIPDSKSGG